MRFKLVYILVWVFVFASLPGCVGSESTESKDLKTLHTDSETKMSAVAKQEEIVSMEVVPPADTEINDVFEENVTLDPVDSCNTYFIEDVEYIGDEYSTIEIKTVMFGIVNILPTYYFSGPRYLALFLEKNGELVYQLPASDMMTWFFVSLEEIFCGDINSDGLDDLVIVTLCTASTSPAPINSMLAIYLQTQDGFINSDTFDWFVEENVGWFDVTVDASDWHPDARVMHHYRTSCDEILKFINSQDIDWYQYFGAEPEGDIEAKMCCDN